MTRQPPKAKRGNAGQFQKGTAPGPGRPKGVQPADLTTPDLVELASLDPLDNAYLHAMLERDAKRLRKELQHDFPPDIVARRQRLVELSDLAQKLLIARMKKALNGLETDQKPEASIEETNPAPIESTKPAVKIEPPAEEQGTRVP